MPPTIVRNVGAFFDGNSRRKSKAQKNSRLDLKASKKIVKDEHSKQLKKRRRKKKKKDEGREEVIEISLAAAASSSEANGGKRQTYTQSTLNTADCGSVFLAQLLSACKTTFSDQLSCFINAETGIPICGLHRYIEEEFGAVFAPLQTSLKNTAIKRYKEKKARFERGESIVNDFLPWLPISLDTGVEIHERIQSALMSGPQSKCRVKMEKVYQHVFQRCEEVNDAARRDPTAGPGAMAALSIPKIKSTDKGQEWRKNLMVLQACEVIEGELGLQTVGIEVPVDSIQSDEHGSRSGARRVATAIDVVCEHKATRQPWIVELKVGYSKKFKGQGTLRNLKNPKTGKLLVPQPPNNPRNSAYAQLACMVTMVHQSTGIRPKAALVIVNNEGAMSVTLPSWVSKGVML